MPRTGGVYSEPAGTKATPNTTIQSAPYNAFVDDLVADANGARPITAGGTGATNATSARANLGLAIGTNVQAYDAGLTSIASLTPAAGQMLYTTGSNVYATTAITAFGRSFLDDANAAAGRTTLGLGTASVQDTGTSGANVPLMSTDNNWSGGQNFTGGMSVQATGTGNISYNFLDSSGVSRAIIYTTNSRDLNFQTRDSSGNSTGTMTLANGNLSMSGSLALGSGGTGATTAAGARTNLGLGTAATRDTGTSGTTVPLLSAANTWSQQQTFSAGLNFGNDDTLTYDDNTNEWTWATDGNTSGSGTHNMGRIRLTSTTDASETSTAHAFQIGPDNGANLRLDGNEILTVNNGAPGAALYIQNGITFNTGVTLAVTDGGTGASTAAAARTNLGLGSIATQNSVNNGDWSGTDLSVANGGTGASTAADARTNLGLGPLSTLDFTDLVSTSSSATNTTFPISTVIAAYSPSLVNLGASATIRLGTTNDFYANTGSGTVVPGTWRCRGTLGADRQSFEKVG